MIPAPDLREEWKLIHAQSLPVFASMLAFITYALTDHNLDPARIFSSLALFNALRLPLNLLPMVIGQIIDAWDSMKRIQDYLLAEEMHDEFKWELEGVAAVDAKNAEFTWERVVTQDSDGASPGKHPHKKHPHHFKRFSKDPENSAHARDDDRDSADRSSALTEKEPFKLHAGSFAFGRNELIAVIGSVGSGKSSLLAALAGDMRKTSGEVTMGADRAFCPQYAWIQNATVRENILFGKEYNKSWYSKVIDACALGPDLDMLPDGDQTEIGERGITVSGGQKQRINIARAIYFNADIVLMDDPLSAVDAHVGRHMFDHAICGLLRNKCRVLATHQLHVLNRCDRIMWMQEGRIAAFDTYDNLMANNEEFSKMMVSTAADEEQEQAEEDDKIDKNKKHKRKGKHGAALMQAEERAVKSVPWSVWAAYISASGTILNGPLLVMLLIISQSSNIATSLWLSYWTSDKFNFPMGVYVRLPPLGRT